MSQAKEASKRMEIMDYTTDRFLAYLYENRPSFGLSGTSDEALPGWLAQKREQLRAIIGLDKLDALNHTAVWGESHIRQADGYTLAETAVETLPNLFTPVYILSPSASTVSSASAADNTALIKGDFVYLHGHGLGAVEVVDEAFAERYQQCLPVQLARAGYRVYVPELMGFNRMVARDYNVPEEAGCYANTTRLLLHGITMTGMRVHQALRVIDRINSLSKATEKPPIIGGISGGGLTAAYTAALRPLIGGAFISCYANTFKGSIMTLLHCVDNFVPNILSVGEEPDIISLACPTPLLISAGDSDDIFPLAHTYEAVEKIRRVYGRQNAEDALSVEIFNGGHQISTKALLPWLERLHI